MFRVKIQVPKELASQYVERIKTGVRGVGYVKTKDPRGLAGAAAEPRARQAWQRSADGEPPMPASPSSAASAAGPVVSIQERHPSLRQASSRSTASRSRSRAASWSASSAPTASASRR